MKFMVLVCGVILGSLAANAAGFEREFLTCKVIGSEGETLGYHNAELKKGDGARAFGYLLERYSSNIEIENLNDLRVDVYGYTIMAGFGLDEDASNEIRARVLSMSVYKGNDRISKKEAEASDLNSSVGATLAVPEAGVSLECLSGPDRL